ncbi:unnamed protein product [Effrenium voratum]|uniref:START domain-containing protein n=1 Tax=Effrenium voratum TaxID=2562239 RepID=A0AA36NCG2_9DINO|nr:unnamed protein product [Effrenium voratum]
MAFARTPDGAPGRPPGLFEQRPKTPIAQEEVEALLELESHAGGWAVVKEEENVRLELWPSGDEPSEIFLLRGFMTLPGVAPETATKLLYDPDARRAWDTELEKLEELPQAEEGVFHVRTVSKFGLLPQCDVIHRRRKVAPCQTAFAAWLCRDVELDIPQESGDSGGWDDMFSWVGALQRFRLRGAILGHVVRSNEDGCRVFTYLQMQATPLVSLLGPRLAPELFTGVGQAYAAACTGCAAITTSQEAVSMLRGAGWTVHAEVFAEPQRLRNSMWSQCLQDFIDVVRDMSAAGHHVLVLVPKCYAGTVKRFEAVATQVLPLSGGYEETRVLAILHPSGQGEVQRRTAVLPPLLPESEMDAVRHVLMDTGFSAHQAGAFSGLTKFWYANSCGPLVVYPYSFAYEAVAKRIQECRDVGWRRSTNNLVFVLPWRHGSFSNKRKSVFGHVMAYRIVKGGGPFMLPDSRKVVLRVLSRLGYFDRRWNADEAEAMLTFCRSSRNKKNLRKLGLLPEEGDAIADIRDKLRAALLSDETRGHWQPSPSDQDVQARLRKKGLLQTQTSREEVLRAMKAFARKLNLPPMKTYNGYAASLLSHINAKDPSRRDVIDLRLKRGQRERGKAWR